MFTGFGKFTSNRRAERQGVNPRTGERVTIKAANVPKFSAGSQLKAPSTRRARGNAVGVRVADGRGPQLVADSRRQVVIEHMFG